MPPLAVLAQIVTNNFVCPENPAKIPVHVAGKLSLQSRARESGDLFSQLLTWIGQLFQISLHRPRVGPRGIRISWVVPTTHQSSVYRPKTRSPTFLHASTLIFCRECCPVARPGVAEICNSASMAL